MKKTTLIILSILTINISKAEDVSNILDSLNIPDLIDNKYTSKSNLNISGLKIALVDIDKLFNSSNQVKRLKIELNAIPRDKLDSKRKYFESMRESIINDCLKIVKQIAKKNDTDLVFNKSGFSVVNRPENLNPSKSIQTDNIPILTYNNGLHDITNECIRKLNSQR